MAYWQGGGGDAASGAMTGAMLGSMVPGVGTVAGGLAGAAIGGLGGWAFGGSEAPQYGYDPNQSNFQLPGYEGMAGQYAGYLGQGPRSAPQAGQSGFRAGQSDLANMLMNQARGRGPGQDIAQMQAERQVDRGLSQQLAGARSARPGQSAMAARNAAMASGQLQGEGAAAATMGGLRAQQGAIGSLGNVLGQARGQDQHRALANAQLQYQTMGLDDRRQLDLLRQQLSMNQMQQHGNQAFERSLQDKAAAEYGYAASQPSQWDKFMGAAQGMGMGYMAMKAGQQGGIGGAGAGGYQLPSSQSIPGGMGGGSHSGAYGGAPNSYGLPDPGSGYQNPVGYGVDYSDAGLADALLGPGQPQQPQGGAYQMPNSQYIPGGLGQGQPGGWNPNWQ